VAQSAGKPVIITEVAWGFVGRSHIGIWDADGNRLGWYINAGGSRLCLATDFDNDGRLELFFLNYNNPMNCTALLVIKVDSAFGTSPPYVGNPCYAPDSMKGTQVAYILFPVSDLGNVDGESALPYNQPATHGVVELENGLLGVYVAESQQVDNVELIYSIDRRYRAVAVKQSDQFEKRRAQLVRKGFLLPVSDVFAYMNRLCDTVMYWTNSGWVTEGQMRAAGQ
jgi:hypothetical protein